MTPEQAAAKGKSVAIAAIDEAELAVRMAEAVLRIKRVPGRSASEAIATMPADWGVSFQRGARAAMDYWRECLEQAQRPS